MYKKVFLILCSILLLGTVVSCGGGGGDSPPLPPQYGPGNLTLYNDTSLTINELYLTPANESTWGPDQLISDLWPGDSYTLTGITPGIYDVKATIVGTLSIYYGYIYDIPIEEWRTYDLYAYDSDFSGSLEIVNDTVGAYIEEIYVSPAGSSSWGPNQITSSMAPGDYIHLYDLSSGHYDIWIVWDIGPDTYYPSLNIISLTLLTLDAN
ncbi:MAG: hypothetical protein R6W75_00250 [Smithellaceae bacterium]